MPVKSFVATGLVSASILLTLSAQQPSPNDRFHQAIRGNDLSTLRTLVTGAGANARDSGGRTPLMLAAAFGTPDAVRMLLANGADAKAAGAGGATPLHWSVRDLRKVRLLLDAGADVHAKTQLGRTPLMVAASTTGSLDVVRLLLEKGAVVDAAENTGVTPLVAAVGIDDVAVAKLLLEKGANPNAAGEVATRHALSAAASNGNAELVRLLLARGANVNAATSENAGGTVKQGRIQFASVTALHLSVIGGNPEVVRLLLDAGARVDPMDIRGMTPLMWSVSTDRPQPPIVRMLLAGGASVSIRSKADGSAIDWVRKFNNPAVLAEFRLTRASASAAAAQPAASHAAATAREAVERSMPLLRRASASVMTDGGCVACHAQPMSAMAADLAAARGWNVTRAGADAAQAAQALTNGAPVLLQAREGGGFPDSQLFISMMLAATHAPASVGTDAMVYYLAAKQRREGNWHVTGGTRAPIQDGDFFRTAVALQALKVYGTPALRAEFDERVARAAGWLERETPISTQDRTMQLLGLKWASVNARLRETRLRELMALQRPDGGWAQTPHLESDAYATGQVLYTVAELGVRAADPAVQRAVAFLLRTQKDDGSWFVRNRAMKIQPYFESGFPYGHDQWISQTGTSWAAIGLAVTARDAAVSTTASR
jgi:ankyrin repeat protein